MGLFRKTSEPKVFFIGFNKTGTNTLHFFFKANGYSSVHHKQKPWHKLVRRPFIAIAMEENIAAGRSVLHGISQYQIYSDLTYASNERHVEANAFFREFEAAAPGSYFIFNDRPVENWIRSRLNHVNARFGSLIENQMAVNGLEREATIAMWRELYSKRKAEILEHFSGNPRFMVFNIEQDRPEKLAEFLKPDFTLDCGKWVHRGKARKPVLTPN